jgi:hypothetical protein
MPLDDPPPKRFASDTDGAKANAEDSAMAAAKNRFFIANPLMERVIPKTQYEGNRPEHKRWNETVALSFELWQRAKFRGCRRERPAA